MGRLENQSLSDGNGDGTVNSDDLKAAQILIVDDEKPNVDILARMLGKMGYSSIATTTSGREACELFRSLRPELVLLDLHMPELDGYGVMAAMKAHLAPPAQLPVLVITGDHDPDVQAQALSAGARDFVTKPFNVTEVMLRIERLLETQLLYRRLSDWNEDLQGRVQERTRDLEDAKAEILSRLALVGDYRDELLGGHAERVGTISALIAQAMGLPTEFVELIRQAAPLHDIGKIGISDQILTSPAKLTALEFELVKSHTKIGARVLSGSKFSVLQMAESIALTHHECWDGTGYPQGLEREEIPLEGRIVAVADVFDSTTNGRPHRVAAPTDEGVQVIRTGRGLQFDPTVADTFLQLEIDGQVAKAVSECGSSLGAGADGSESMDRKTFHDRPIPDFF